MTEQTEALAALEALMAKAHIKGQWQVGSNRPENAARGLDGRMRIEPRPAARPTLWAWRDIEPILDGACRALPESFTARRSMIFMNPGLARGTTATLMAGVQIIQPGEIAWAHRHSVNALRFTIQGGEDVFTVVDGEALPMHPYDLVLTPGWVWHDHHNGIGRPAIWLDVLDVPFIGAIDQNFYEELGETVQDRRNVATDATSHLLRPLRTDNVTANRAHRYPWTDVRARLDALAEQPPHPADGVALEYVNPATGGAALPTLSCVAQLLPPGFSGARRRRAAGAVHFVVAGEGAVVLDDTTLAFSRHDGIAVPNWTWHRLTNTSSREPAVLFTVTDRPIADAFGLYREQIED